MGGRMQGPEETGEFDPAPRFAGVRPGFVFKLGRQGLGYYGDRLEQQRHGIAGGCGGSGAEQEEPGADDMPPPFQRAPRFQGARPGCVFKKGSEGLGYYADRLEMQRIQRGR